MGQRTAGISNDKRTESTFESEDASRKVQPTAAIQSVWGCSGRDAGLRVVRLRAQTALRPGINVTIH